MRGVTRIWLFIGDVLYFVLSIGSVILKLRVVSMTTGAPVYGIGKNPPRRDRAIAT